MIADLHTIIDYILLKAGSYGPCVFFLAMTIIPLVGFPMLAFLIVSSSLYSKSLGVYTALTLSLIAMSSNMVISYYLASKRLRPVIELFVKRWEFKMPQLADHNSSNFILLVRLSPVIPFFAQNYVLGIMQVPFIRYILISVALNWPVSIGIFLFGDAIFKGDVKKGITSITIILFSLTLIYFLKKY